MNRLSAILYVIHDTDGEWQFLDGQDVTVDDLMIVSLKQMVDHDSSIEKLLDLEKGFEAARRNLKAEWFISKTT